MNLDEFIRSDWFDSWRGSRDSSMALDDPDRFERCQRAAEDGADGSTHGEIIEDWREALCTAHLDEYITEDEYECMLVECQETEDWHEDNGSLEQEVG